MMGRAGSMFPEARFCKLSAYVNIAEACTSDQKIVRRFQEDENHILVKL